MARANITVQRRREIVDATVRVMGARGWNETSIDEIAKEASVSRGLVSYHFKDKNELLSGVLERCREMFIEAVRGSVGSEEPPEQQMRCATHASLLMSRENPVPYEIFLHFSTSGLADPRLAEQIRDLYRTYRSVTAAAIRRGQELGYYRAGFDPLAAAAKHQGTIIGIALQWIIDPGAFDLEAAADQAADMLMAALAA